MKANLKMVFSVFYILCILCTLNAQAPKDQKIPVSPDVKIGKLANGLTYYIRKNQEPKNRAELRLVVNAGSILETESQLGLAHFAEHMAFNGTKNFKKQELVNFLEKSGVQFGADLNAYTSFDETVYMLPLPTDSADVFKKGFQILEDWAHNVTFDNKEIDKERGVVIEEWRLGLGAGERMRAKYFPVILKGSLYATRLPIGTKKNLEIFKYQTLKDFYKEWYRPDLQAVIAVGDFDVAEVEALIIQHFAKIPKRVNPKPRKKFGIPAQVGSNAIVLTDPEQTYNIVQVFYKQTAIPEPQTQFQFRNAIVREMFNRMMSTRLEEIAQKPDAPFLYGGSSYGKLIGDKDALILAAVAKDGSTLGSATEAVIRENERVRQHGFAEGELDRAKRSLLSSMENAYDERDKTKSAVYVQELINHFLNKEPIPGIEYEFHLYKQYLPTITLKEVNALISSWIRPTDRSIIVMAPESEKKNLTSEKNILALLNKPVGKLTAYEDKVVKGAILASTPVAGKVIGQQKVDELGVTELTLSNGAKVILKPTTFKNNEILFSAISPGGSSLYSDADYLSASNASSVAFYGGIGNFDIMSLQKELSDKQVRVSPSVGQYSEGLSGSSTPKDLEVAMQLLHGYFTEPRKDSSMFLVMKQQITAGLVNKGKDPSSVFSDTVSYVMGNYHYRRRPLTVETLNDIKLDKAFEVYKARYANAGDFIFTFVGNFTVESITPLIEKYIASLPSTASKENWKDVGIRFPSGVVKKVVKKGQEKQATVRMTFTGVTQYSDMESTQLDQLCKAFGIQLREVMREDQGGVYGVGVSGNINREPINSYAINISFSCAPENVEKLTSTVIDEMKKIKTSGVPQVNVRKVIAEDTRKMEIAVKENSYWLYNLEQKYHYKEDPKILLEDAAMVKKLTVERTKELANKYFNENSFLQFVLMPEK
jgi:zinc protease